MQWLHNSKAKTMTESTSWIINTSPGDFGWNAHRDTSWIINTFRGKSATAYDLEFARTIVSKNSDPY